MAKTYKDTVRENLWRFFISNGFEDIPLDGSDLLLRKGSHSFHLHGDAFTLKTTYEGCGSQSHWSGTLDSMRGVSTRVLQAFINTLED